MVNLSIGQVLLSLLIIQQLIQQANLFIPANQTMKELITIPLNQVQMPTLQK